MHLRRCGSRHPSCRVRSLPIYASAGPWFETLGGRGGPSGPSAPSAPSAPSRHLAISPSCRASRGRRPCFCSPGGPHAVASRASSRARASAGSSSSGTLLVAKCAAVWLIVAGLLARGAGVNARLSSLPFSTTASRVACTGGVGYPVCPAGGARTMLLEGDRRALRCQILRHALTIQGCVIFFPRWRHELSRVRPGPRHTRWCPRWGLPLEAIR